MSLVEPPDPAPDRGAQAQPLPPADTRIVVELLNRWIAVPAAIDFEIPEVGKSSPWSFGSPDIFCRDTTLATVGLETLLAGATVDCETEQGLRGPEVLRIRAVDFSTASLRPGPPAGPRAERARPAAPAASDSGRRVRGLVKWFMPMKGYGFLEPEDGSPDVFCHVGAVEASGRDTLPQGAVVTCDFVQGDRGPQVSRIFEVETPAVEPRLPAGARPFDSLHPGPYAGAQPAADMELPGTVKFYDPARGFGFVVPDPPVHEHRLVLADPVRPVHGLAFHRRLPPRVVDDDPVNDLDAEHRSGRQGRTAVRFTRRDFVILDELGHLPFAPFCPGAGDHLLFHLMSRFDERTSIVVTTNLAFGEWPSVHDCGNVGSLHLDDYQMIK